MPANNSLTKTQQQIPLNASVGDNVRKVLAQNQHIIETACKIWGLSPQSMIRAAAALVESIDYSGNEKSSLKLCTGESVLNAITECARLGLDPSFGRAYLIPYKFRRTDPDNAPRRAQLQISYIGMIDLSLRNKDIKKVGAEVVFEGDDFQVELGVNPSIKHYPKYQSEEIIFAYAYAVFANEELKMTVLPKFELEKIQSKSPSSKAWQDFYGEMAKKAAIKRLFKTLPKLSAEAHQAVEIDNTAQIEFAPKEYQSNAADKLQQALESKVPAKKQPEPEMTDGYEDPDDFFGQDQTK